MSQLPRAAELVAGIREVLADLDGAPCSFWACPGPDHPPVPMATCRICDVQQQLHELLGDPDPTCTALECVPCGRESPWCDTCDEKLIHCDHAPQDAA